MLFFGVIEGGPIPSDTLSATDFDGNFVTGQVIGPNEQYAGPFWTGWSNNYGCPAENINPIASNGAEGNRKFCRYRTKDINLDAIKVRYCTLPDKRSGTPFEYDPAPAANAVNKYYSPWHEDQPKIMSKFVDPQSLNNANFFDEFQIAKKNWTTIQPPPGDEDSLHGWSGSIDVQGLYTIADRRSIYKGMLDLHSSRIACDARLAVAAEQCFNGAFNLDGNFLGNQAFCDTFTLQQVKDKCAVAACTGEISEFSTRSQADTSKHPIVEGLILLIEEILEEKFTF